MQLVFIIGTVSIKIAEVIIGNIGKASDKKMTKEELERGGTSIEENGKIWDIKNIKDYYNYLISLQN